MPRCKVVSASNPVHPTDATRIVEAAEHALIWFAADGPLVVQVATDDEMRALGHEQPGRVVYGTADRSTVFLHEETLRYEDADFAALVFEEVAHWSTFFGDPFWDELWACWAVCRALDVEWDAPHRGQDRSAYEWGRAVGSRMADDEAIGSSFGVEPGWFLRGLLELNPELSPRWGPRPS